MAITTIPWGDGSGDNIYLSAPSQTGDQSVSVTSDPNTGAARSKVVTFSASGVSPVSLTISQDAGAVEQYIVFDDPVCEQICANAWGDGIGLKPSEAAAVTSIGTTFQNTAIVSFEEFAVYFTGVTSLVNDAFSGCSSLESITIASRVTTYGNNIFGGCTALKSLVIEYTGTLALQNIMTGGSAPVIGDGTGTLRIAGSIGTSTRNNYNLRFDTIEIGGDFNPNMTQRYPFNANTLRTLKIGGNLTAVYMMTTANCDFIGVDGSITTSTNNTFGTANRNTILHFGYSGGGVAIDFSRLASNLGNFNTYYSAIYVGDGSSQAHDEAVLADYLNDAGWSQVSSKLHTWWSYLNP